jgi:hypothetical protein
MIVGRWFGLSVPVAELNLVKLLVLEGLEKSSDGLGIILCSGENSNLLRYKN